MRKLIQNKYIALPLFLLCFLFCHQVCLPGVIWAAEFEVPRDEEDSTEEEIPYDEDFDAVFDDPAEDIVVEEPANIDYKNQFEESKKIVVKGDFIIRAGGGFGWVDEPLKGKPEGLAGAYSKALLSFDAKPDPTIRIFGRLKTEMNSDNGSDVWCMPYFDELYCDYNWLDKSFFRLGKFYMTWGQGRLFRPANFMEDAEKGTSLRMTIPNLFDGVSADEYSLLANTLAAGPYSRAKKTEVGGYWEKLFGAALQNIQLDGEGTDCGTKKYLTVTLTEKNINSYMYNYIIKDNGDLEELTSDNMSKYLGKTVKMRFSIFCKSKTGICNKCAGNLFVRRNAKNIGLSCIQMPSTVKVRMLKA